MSDIIAVEGEIVEQEEVRPWDQLPGEPDKWFVKFQRYYVPIGVARSVREAYRRYCEDQHPERLTDDGKLTYAATPRNWSEYAHIYKWSERALAFDKYTTGEALDSVQLALSILKDAAPDAAEALVSALGNARTRVPAAEKILNRVGLPEVKRVESLGLQVTPSDIQRAREELEQWKKEQTQRKES